MGAVSEYAIKNRKEYFRNWYLKNKEKLSAQAKRRYQANRDKVLTYTKIRQRPYLLKKLYGLTVEQYDAMLASQGGACKVCGSDGESKDKRRKYLSVDHCHNTGKIRGLLCMKCNADLGTFELRREAFTKYLEETNGS